jgi:hypothetical protein
MCGVMRRCSIYEISRASAIGPDTAMLTTLILEGRPHREQGFRACLGILRLARHYGSERLEAASTRGLEIGAPLLRLHQLDPTKRPRPPAEAGGGRPRAAASSPASGEQLCFAHDAGQAQKQTIVIALPPQYGRVGLPSGD